MPVDANGAFVAEEILPAGLHTVEVAVLDGNGNGELYLRDLELDKSDWFTVGIADLTLSGNKTNGPAKLLNPENPRYSEDFSLQGRLAFYSSGNFDNGWSLTAGADTREGPLDEIFSNFIEKSGDALFRRMDPDRHYPTFGDDSTVTETAPTSGKFFLRMKKDETYGLWGISRSLTRATTWLFSIVIFTAPTCATNRLKPLPSARRGCCSTVSARIPEPSPGGTNSAGPAARCSICSSRIFWKVPSGCASRCATRIPIWCWPARPWRRNSITTSITCRDASCSPPCCRRPRMTTCWSAALP